MSAAKRKYLPFRKLQPPENLEDFTSFPFFTIGYKLSAENSVHKLATNLDVDASKLLRVNHDPT